MDIITQKVDAGLRAINKTPAAFMFIDRWGDDWTWDEPEILGIPVYHGIKLVCYEWDNNIDECRFIPMGLKENDITYVDRKRFAEAYNDFQAHQGGQKLCIVEGN